MFKNSVGFLQSIVFALSSSPSPQISSRQVIPYFELLLDKIPLTFLAIFFSSSWIYKTHIKSFQSFNKGLYTCILNLLLTLGKILLQKAWIWFLSWSHFFFFFFSDSFIHLFLIALGLCRCLQDFSSCQSGRLLFIGAHELLIPWLLLLWAHTPGCAWVQQVGGSSRLGIGGNISCIGRQTLNRWTTREFPVAISYFVQTRIWKWETVLLSKFRFNFLKI